MASANPVPTNRTVSPNIAKEEVLVAFQIRRPIFLWGPPGIGKSDIVHQLGTILESPVIDVRLSLWEPTDIKGIPYFNSTTETMQWAPPCELPTQEYASKHKYVILFLDELPNALPSVQAATYQLILNRRVGQYKLPDNVLIVAAGNRDSDKGVTYKMPMPLANRFIHLELKVDFDDWQEWALENRVHPDVVGYLSFSKNDLFNFDARSNERAFPTPRSWTTVSDILYVDNIGTSISSDLVAGTVGDGLSTKFSAYRKIAELLPLPSDVLDGKVTKMNTDEVSAMYSIATSMCYELKDCMDKDASDVFYKKLNNFFIFMLDNFEKEITIMATRMAFHSYKIVADPTMIPAMKRLNAEVGKFITRRR